MAILIQYANGVPGVKFALDKPEITIGRSLENDIAIDDEFVSKKHAVIHVVTDEETSEVACILIDNNSTNHSYVNSQEVSAHQLDENDKIFIGENEFRLVYESSLPTGLHTTPRGFFADDAPGLMHKHIEDAALETTSLRKSEPEDITVGLDKNISLVEDETSEKKRFSRRLSLI